MKSNCLLLSEKRLHDNETSASFEMTEIVSLLSLVFQKRRSLDSSPLLCIRNDTKGIDRDRGCRLACPGHLHAELARIDGTVLEIKEMLEEVLDASPPLERQVNRS